MPLQSKFNRFSTAAPIVATASFQEIRSGTNFDIYYAFSSDDVGSRSFNLSTTLPRSMDIEKTIATGSSIDFDLSSFGIGQIASGTAIVTFSFKYVETIGGQASYLKIELIHYDGTDETIMGSDQTGNLTATTEENWTFNIDIAETIFGIGDILRMRVSVVEVVGPAGANFTFGIDPANRDGANLTPSSEDRTTQLKTVFPYKSTA